jgi:hypothetical protein
MTINPYNPTSTRYCQNCQTTQPIDGGKHIPCGGPIRQRWLCGQCIEKRIERQNRIAKTTEAAR